MIDWYNSLNLLQRIYALIAIPSTVILLIQTIMLFFGFGDDDVDMDMDIDDVADVSGGGDGLVLFSIRGIIAMLCVGGWSGILFSELGMTTPLTVILSAILGVAALIGMAALIKLLLQLQSSGNIVLANAIGKVGQVYLTIPPSMSGMGKVNITLQEKYSEFNAMTKETEIIKTGEMIRVVSTDDVGYVVVERLNNNNKNK